jgi:hypothetical protein
MMDKAIKKIIANQVPEIKDKDGNKYIKRAIAKPIIIPIYTFNFIDKL